MSQSIDKLLEEADEDPYAFGPAGVKQLSSEVQRLREREKVLTEALEKVAEYIPLWDGERYCIDGCAVAIARAALASGTKEKE